MSSLIIPACGSSSRYPGMRPKWLLTHPDGNAMLVKSIEGLPFPAQEIDTIYITVLKKHVEKYEFTNKLTDKITIALLDAYPHKYNGSDSIKWVVLDEPTSSQSETVALTIEKENIQGQIYINDTDNYFTIPSFPKGNCIACVDSRTLDFAIHPANKSYVQIEQETVVNIAEKSVISNHFCCGLYGFTDAQDFVKRYYNLIDITKSPWYTNGVPANLELYISHIISAMLLEGQTFITSEAKKLY